MLGVQDVALQAIANPRRREMLRLVWDGERTSSDIAAHFDISWPAVSQNLGVLKNAGLIRERRIGTRRLYRVDRARLGPLKAVLKAMWEADLNRLAHLAEAEERRTR
ncbi:MAG: winged helix-turn-helix transcriptional regulator [Chloroflexi bacterium]|nr:MAG: winged helix-turn-helix transcriptional regulator [Chloroflexota bacterium]